MSLEKYNGTAIRKFDDATDGNLDIAAQVRVNVSGGGIASIFSDAAGTTPLTNPLTTDSNGAFEYYAAPGYYDNIINDGNVNEYTKTVQLGNTPENVVILEDADAGNIGKGDLLSSLDDLNDYVLTGFFWVNSEAPNNPSGNSGSLTVTAFSSSISVQLFQAVTSDIIFFRRQLSGVWQPWKEIWNSTTRSAASAETVVNNADASNRNILGPEIENEDYDTYKNNQTRFFAAGSLNAPDGTSAFIVNVDGGRTTGSLTENNRLVQVAYSYSGSNLMFIRGSSATGFNEWSEVWQSKTRTAASAETVVNNADASNVGENLTSIGSINADELPIVSTTINYSTSWQNSFNPVGMIFQMGATSQDSGRGIQLFGDTSAGDVLAFRRKSSGNFQPWRELYHTGNTDGIGFQSQGQSAPVGDRSEFYIDTLGTCYRSAVSTGNTAGILFYNGNGKTGDIRLNGTVTEYNTSSDPRLKSEFKPVKVAKIWGQFNDLMAAYGEFTFKADSKTKMLGFNAHALLDAGFTDIATEGEGPRESAINETYDTTEIPAEYELIEVLDEEGAQVLDEDGEPLKEKREVKARDIIEHKTTPAGVDHSKIVPYLMPLIEDLQKRLLIAEQTILELNAGLPVTANQAEKPRTKRRTTRNKKQTD